MSFETAMEWVVIAFEVAGITILAAGSLRALVTAGAAYARGQRTGVYERARLQVGQAILLGLEVLIIAAGIKDIVLKAGHEFALFEKYKTPRRI